MGIIRYYGNDINKVALRYFSSSFLGSSSQGFERDKDGNRGKFIGSDLVICCYKEFEKFALCKSVSQSEATFIVYADM